MAKLSQQLRLEHKKYKYEHNTYLHETKSEESAKMSSTSGEGFDTCILPTGNDESPGTAGLMTLSTDAVAELGECAEDIVAAAAADAATVAELSLCV